jgi:hypothetical protein
MDKVKARLDNKGVEKRNSTKDEFGDDEDG